MKATPTRSRRPLTLAISLALAAGGVHAATITVNTSADNTTAGDGYCTLREAIGVITAEVESGDCGNSGAGFGTNDTIVFNSAVPSASTITLGGTELSVVELSAPLTIQGGGQTIDANNHSSILYVESAALSVSNLTLTGGNAGAGHSTGGGIFARYHSTLTLTNVAVTDNFAYKGGGVFASYDTTVTLTGSTVSDNIAFNGGGVYADQGTVTLNNSTVSDNFADLDGGGIYASQNSLTLNNSTVSGNSAYYGGGTYSHLGSLTLTSATISGNTASWKGGGMYAHQTAVTLNGSRASGNSVAIGRGGGMYANLSPVMLTDSTLSGNSAAYGGGMFNEQGTLTLSKSDLSDNSASSGGGGVYASANSILIVTNSTISGNSAGTGGGGVYALQNAVVTLANATLTENSAVNGGGMLTSRSTVTLTNSTVSGNSASNAGGGLYAYGSTATLSMTNTIVSGNTATHHVDLDLYLASLDANYSVLGTALDKSPYDNSAYHNIFTDNPQLSALNDNGGPTLTMALMSGSPAIDAGADTVCAAPPVNDVDQRGITRPLGAHCDIGAYELVDDIFADGFELGP